jgi:hypothetical protein
MRGRDDRRGSERLHSDRRRGSDWETGTPLRRAPEDEWEATPSRAGDGGPRRGSSLRPGTGASAWELASPAPAPVRAGSGKRARPGRARVLCACD